MIKINLVPVKEKKKRREFIVVFFIALILLLVFLGMFWIYVGRVQVRGDLRSEIKQIEEESKGYQEKINEIKDLERKEASLEAFKKTIKGIAETQRKVTVAIDQLALNLPDGVWFTAVTQGRGADANKFMVQGYAFSQSNLRNYFDSLQKPGGFLRDVTFDIKSISASVGNNRQIHQFEISAKVMELGS